MPLISIIVTATSMNFLVNLEALITGIGGISLESWADVHYMFPGHIRGYHVSGYTQKAVFLYPDSVWVHQI